jgi:hypothetical protein
MSAHGAFLALALLAGCALTHSELVQLPARNSIHSEQLVVLSDFRIPGNSPLSADLKALRESVHTTLELPYGSRPVTVYLFANELTYSQYLKATFPDLPERRAYFVKKTPGDELAVYTAWGDRIQEDLRHEFTHGLLHAAMKTPPLWLDEGLAEYFEVSGAPGTTNRSDIARLTAAVDDGWKPDLKRLESLTKVDQMSRADYREAWAWVHFLLHSSPETKHILLSYLQDLRARKEPTPISERLATDMPNAPERLTSHVASLYTGTAQR